MTEPLKTYRVATVYVGTFLLGYVVVDIVLPSLISGKLYTFEEAEVVAAQWNESEQIRANWPDLDDPDVVALVNDDNWEPIGQNNVDVLASPVYRLHTAAETVARRRAGLEVTDEQ